MKSEIKLTCQAFEEFKKTWQEEDSDPLSDAEAAEMALRIVRLFDLMIQEGRVEDDRPAQ